MFSCVNTDVYCLFKTEALPLASEMRVPSAFNGDTPHGSFRLDLIYALGLLHSTHVSHLHIVQKAAFGLNHVKTNRISLSKMICAAAL